MDLDREREWLLVAACGDQGVRSLAGVLDWLAAAGDDVVTKTKEDARVDTMTPASPLPWMLGAPAICVADAAGAPIALLVNLVSHADGGDQPRLDDARYIVRSANLYPELVAALTRCLRRLQAEHSAQMSFSGVVDAEMVESIRQAQAVLEKTQRRDAGVGA